MKATHRVKDSNNNSIGFMVDGRFYTSRNIRDNISSIDNLNVIKNGTIRAKKELPWVSYNEAVIVKKYSTIVNENPYMRDVQAQFKEWKNYSSHKVLQVEGARQIGKTTELLKFAYMAYEYIIYVNIANDSYNFISILNNGVSPMTMNRYCICAGLPDFVNNRKTVLIIDEIQSNYIAYNSIREINSQLNCDLIITGSYLGITLQNNKFFLPAGTIYSVKMSTLSFCEFCNIFKQKEALNKLDIFGEDTYRNYEEIYKLYNVYTQIGGYPSVIKTFIETKSIKKCHRMIRDLLNTFKNESRVYFSDTRESDIFEKVYSEAIKIMCNRESIKEIVGKNIVENLAEYISKSTKTTVTRKEIVNAVTWLTYSGILSFCHLAIDGDLGNIVYNRRIYFSDCGIASYIAENSSIDESTLNGILTENFAFCEISKLFEEDYAEIKVLDTGVCFATYGNYEVDFIRADRKKRVYGIEAKTNTGDPKSLRVFIDKNIIDRGIAAKKSKGGHGVKFDTIPIFAVGCRFPYR